MRLFLLKLLSYLPSKLPVGLTEFHKWADEIILLAGKFADEDSMKFALASMIQHSNATASSVPKRTFVNFLRKSAANQVAAQVFQDIKLKQQEAMAKAAAETAAQQPTQTVEVTTGTQVPDDQSKTS